MLNPVSVKFILIQNAAEKLAIVKPPNN